MSPTDPVVHDGSEALAPMRTATLRDVAAIAGVSVATASKALNGRNGVAPVTKIRVRQAAERIGFSPSTLARGLLTGKTGTVGLIASGLESWFIVPILAGVEDGLGLEQINVFLCNARGDAIRERHHLRELLNHGVDGIIAVGSFGDLRPSLGPTPVPIIYVYAASESPDDLSLVPDNVFGGRLAVQHLLGCGRRRIAHITGDPATLAAQDRSTGAAAEIREAGLELAFPTMFGHWTEQWGRDATRLLLERTPDVDAIFAGSDAIARGAIDALRDLGRHVPGDVAVIGFDNQATLAEGSRPQLTTIDQDLEHMGREASRALFAAMGAPKPSGVHRFPGHLVIRQSTMLSA